MRLEGPNDHARAIVKVYNGNVREDLVTGEFCKRVTGPVPSAVLESLASPLCEVILVFRKCMMFA